jgi:hypothetical protein
VRGSETASRGGRGTTVHLREEPAAGGPVPGGQGGGIARPGVGGHGGGVNLVGGHSGWSVHGEVVGSRGGEVAGEAYRAGYVREVGALCSWRGGEVRELP